MSARYSESFKKAIISKALSPDSESIRAVSKEHDIPIGTVLGWIKKMNPTTINEKVSNPAEGKPVKSYSVIEKLTTLTETHTLSEAELAAYCRRKGLYPDDLKAWREEIESHLSQDNLPTLTNENRRLKIALRELKTELNCKEKALAEASALLLLKKKAQIIWGEVEAEK